MTAERLYRKRFNRVFGGVAAGLADYLNLDPVLVRVLFIILALVNGIGLILYIVLWIVIPEDLSVPNYYSKTSGTSNKENVTSDETENSDKSEKTEEQKVNDEYIPNFTMPNKVKGNGRVVFGSVLIGIGIIFLAERFFPFFDFFDLLPVVLIALGIMLIVNANSKRESL